jgi:putative addiction module component (TIGR02574 family)
MENRYVAIDTTLLERSLALSPQERAELAEQLLLSLELEKQDPDAPRLWAEEIQRRQDDLHTGRVSPVDWREAVQRVRSELDGDKAT